MLKRPTVSNNLYFLVPYVLWLIVGGIILAFFSKQMLFALVNTHHSSVLDVIMYYTTWMGEGATITIVLLLLLGLSSLRNWWYFVAALVCNVIPTIIEQSLKSYYNSPRPLNYFHHAAWIHIAPNWPQLMNKSFPSGHSTGSFAFFCFLAMLLPEKYRKFGLLFFFMALSVCYSRMYLAAHFYEDVYVGSFIGGTVCVLLLSLMKRYQPYFFKREDPLTISD